MNHVAPVGAPRAVAVQASWHLRCCSYCIKCKGTSGRGDSGFSGARISSSAACLELRSCVQV